MSSCVIVYSTIWDVGKSIDYLLIFVYVYNTVWDVGKSIDYLLIFVSMCTIQSEM